MAAIGGAELLTRPLSLLSSGQRKRFSLMSLILEKPNILLLDEPTNHLDLLTLEAFENALLDFEGAILAVSHDETFIKKIATEVNNGSDRKLIPDRMKGDVGIKRSATSPLLPSLRNRALVYFFW